MPITTATRITAPRPPYRPFAYQPRELGGSLIDGATLAQHAAHQRDAARYCLIGARTNIARAYSCIRQYRGDPRWGRIPTNLEARQYRATARLFIRAAADHMRHAAELDALAVLPLARAA